MTAFCIIYRRLTRLFLGRFEMELQGTVSTTSINFPSSNIDNKVVNFHAAVHQNLNVREHE